MTVADDSPKPIDPSKFELSKFIEVDPKDVPVYQTEHSDVYKAVYRRDGAQQHKGPVHTMLSYIMDPLNQRRQTCLVAVKQFRQYQQDVNKRTRMFRMIAREMRIWSDLSHLNILPFCGFCGSEHSLALVSPWMEQGPILNYVKTLRQKAEPVDILEIIRGVAFGLQYLHKKEIVHADLKGSNILASMTGTPLLVDFGFSRIVSDKDGLGDVLNTVNFYGTAAWTAIELLSDPTDSAEVPLQTKQSDVWAFAMTVVELITEKSPYPSPPFRRNDQIIAAIQRGELPVMPAKLLQEMKFLPQMWELCRRCWLTPPEERPNITEVSCELCEISCSAYLIESLKCYHATESAEWDECDESCKRRHMLQSAMQTILEIYEQHNLLSKPEHESIACMILKYCHAALNEFLCFATSPPSSKEADDSDAKKHALNKVFCLLRSLARRLEMIKLGKIGEAATLVVDEFGDESEISKYVSAIKQTLEACVSGLDVRTQSEGYAQHRKKLREKILEVEALVEILCGLDNRDIH